MAIPSFDKSSGLLPPGFHPTDMSEFMKKLGFNARRYFLIEDGLGPVAQELLEMNVEYLFVGGSFTTAKISPNDIDGYVLTTFGSDVYRKIADRRAIWKTIYSADFYPAATDLEGEGSQVYWEDLYGHTDEVPPRPRGILKLYLGGDFNVQN